MPEALAESAHPIVRVPIILRDCPWQEHLDGDDIKALPTDGTPVTSYPTKDPPWLEVNNGIKTLVDELRATFTPKPDFLKAIDDSELPSSQPVSLDDIFVFPNLATQPPPSNFAAISGRCAGIRRRPPRFEARRSPRPRQIRQDGPRQTRRPEAHRHERAGPARDHGHGSPANSAASSCGTYTKANSKATMTYGNNRTTKPCLSMT